MENIGLLLGLAKLALEIFKDTRGDRYSRLHNELLKIEKEYHDEMARPDSERSDLALDNLLFESWQASQRIIDASKTR